MIIKTGRFGQVTVTDDEIVKIPQGVLGFPQYHDYCLIDPGDDTLMIWFQSLEAPEIAFPLLEPRVFKQDFSAKLSASELRELKLDHVNRSAVFCILTIPQDVSQMTANLKAPLVINLEAHLAKQIVLQENEYDIRQPMFRELRTHLMTIQSQGRKQRLETQSGSRPIEVIPVKNIPPSFTAKSLIV